MAASDVRYGISALATDYYNYSIEDELMVARSTGKMYYKREDGRVVSYDGNIDQNSLCNSIELAFSDNGITPNVNDYVVYHLINTSDLINMRSDTAFSIGIEDTFPITYHVNGFMVRLHSTDEANAAVAIIDGLTKSLISNPTSAEFKYKVYKSGGVIESRVVDVPFNRLCFIPIENTGSSDVSIQLDSVKFKNFGTAYDSYISTEKKYMLRMLNYETSQFGEEKYYTNTIDFITFASSLSSVPIIAGNRTLVLNSVISMADVDDYTKVYSNNTNPHIVTGS